MMDEESSRISPSNRSVFKNGKSWTDCSSKVYVLGTLNLRAHLYDFTIVDERYPEQRERFPTPSNPKLQDLISSFSTELAHPLFT
nr:hypothetical protein Iba_chr14aCG24340 [Ipomoea batatas]GME15344.1 hypothetical protein Iba_scaffold16120CG0030 [Ipomoea batatas]